MTVDKHLAIAVGAGAGLGLLVAVAARREFGWHILAGLALGGAAGAGAYRLGGTAVWQRLAREVEQEDAAEAAAAAAAEQARIAAEDADETGADPDEMEA